MTRVRFLACILALRAIVWVLRALPGGGGGQRGRPRGERRS